MLQQVVGQSFLRVELPITAGLRTGQVWLLVLLSVPQQRRSVTELSATLRALRRRPAARVDPLVRSVPLPTGEREVADSTGQVLAARVLVHVFQEHQLGAAPQTALLALVGRVHLRHGGAVNASGWSTHMWMRTV